MNDLLRTISLPLDNGYYRRECPYCYREFKILLKEEELQAHNDNNLKTYLIEDDEKGTKELDNSQKEFTCPYCGQKAGKDSWWTKEQLLYIENIKRNIVSEMINENLVKPLQRSASTSRNSLIRLEIKANKIDIKEPFMPPEMNDMKEFYLACCERKIKTLDDWDKGINCFFCGFPHRVA